MKLPKLVEITRIRQEVREPDVALETTHITSPEDAFLVLDASSKTMTVRCSSSSC